MELKPTFLRKPFWAPMGPDFRQVYPGVTKAKDGDSFVKCRWKAGVGT
jgi:hypothetical protein